MDSIGAALLVCRSDAGPSDRKEQDPRAKKTGNSKARKGGGPIGDLRKLVQLVKNNDLLPCIVFSFNRRECEHYAMGIQKMDFTNEEEKDAIKQVRARLDALFIEFAVVYEKALGAC